MGSTSDYTATGVLEVPGIRAVLEKAATFKNFVQPSPETQHGAFFTRKALALGLDRSGLDVRTLTLVGQLKPCDESIGILGSVLTGVEAAPLDMAAIDVTCGFEERSSRQRKRSGYDTISVGAARNERRGFHYTINASRPQTDREYAVTALRALIAAAELPVSVALEGDRLWLAHTQGGEIGPPHPKGVQYCQGFHLRLPPESAEQSVQRIARAVGVCATHRRFEVSWTVSYGWGRGDDPARCSNVHDIVAALGLPAKEIEIQLRFRMQDIEGLGGLRRSCGPKDQMFIELCSFDVGDPDGDRAALQVITSAGGHQLALELRTGTGLPQVTRALGLEFVADAPG